MTCKLSQQLLRQVSAWGQRDKYDFQHGGNGTLGGSFTLDGDFWMNLRILINLIMCILVHLEPCVNNAMSKLFLLLQSVLRKEILRKS